MILLYSYASDYWSVLCYTVGHDNLCLSNSLMVISGYSIRHEIVSAVRTFYFHTTFQLLFICLCVGGCARVLFVCHVCFCVFFSQLSVFWEKNYQSHACTIQHRQKYSYLNTNNILVQKPAKSSQRYTIDIEPHLPQVWFF